MNIGTFTTYATTMICIHFTKVILCLSIAFVQIFGLFCVSLHKNAQDICSSSIFISRIHEREEKSCKFLFIFVAYFCLLHSLSSSFFPQKLYGNVPSSLGTSRRVFLFLLYIVFIHKFLFYLLIPQGINRIEFGCFISRIVSKEYSNRHRKCHSK